MNKLTDKQNRDRQRESRMTAMVGEGLVGGGRIEQKGKRTHGHGQQCGDCYREGV